MKFGGLVLSNTVFFYYQIHFSVCDVSKPGNCALALFWIVPLITSCFKESICQQIGVAPLTLKKDIFPSHCSNDFFFPHAQKDEA